MKNILIIEDNENMLQMMCDLLGRSGYSVITATDGVQGLKAFHTHSPALVITDIIMPDKEGLEVIMELTKQEPRPKIIAVSGGGILEPQTYLSLARKLGADHALAKPFRPAELLALIEHLLA
ncbi:MAG TPA: response regulator [Desulfobulbaceae bacterium]|nr:response regulator [Desulfobulbaceae bacterium]